MDAGAPVFPGSLLEEQTVRRPTRVVGATTDLGAFRGCGTQTTGDAMVCIDSLSKLDLPINDFKKWDPF